MSNNPSISIVMPVYNAERFLREAIDSILKQTYTDFEFVIVNDGSTDKSSEIIKSYNDERIVLLENPQNKGLSYSFNRGISASKGKYIARMDADDIALPDRLDKQVRYLEQHTDIDILGSSMIGIDERGKKLRLYPRDNTHKLVKFSSLFSTPLYHPTIMAKASVLKSHHYNENMTNSEDYELWSRLLFTTSVKFANIERPLLLYRTYPTSFTQTINLDRRIASAHNTIENLKHYIDLTEKDKSILISLRQEKRLSIIQTIDNFSLYVVASLYFSDKERVSLREIVKIIVKLARHGIFLTKHYIKHFSA